MPTYEYECPDCGPFSDVRPMAEFDRPQPCPDCGAMAPRLLACTAISGGAAEPASAAPARSHPGGCACCMAPRRFSADAV
jgi:putative FmdB family regulatory protein